MRLLKQSTARDILVFMSSAVDHITGKTGLTLTITASKNGGAFSSITPTVTERGDGWYSLALTAAHTDTLGDFALHITGTDADPTDLVSQVIAELPQLPATIAAAVWDRVLTGATHNIPTSAGRRLRIITPPNATDGSVNDGTPSDTTFVTNLTSEVDNFYAGQTIFFTNGDLDGQARIVESYNGTTKAITVVTPFTSAPANADTFTIQADRAYTPAEIGEGVWDYADANLVTVGLRASQVPVKKNTALSAFTFPMIDGNGDPATGLTVAAQRSIDGAAFGDCANSVTEIGNGFYKINLAASDLNGNVIALKFTASGVKQLNATVLTQ